MRWVLDVRAGPIAQVVSAFAKKKVQGLKSGGFNSEKDDKHKSLRCSLKAVDGHLYPLDKCFFFISTKPVSLGQPRGSSRAAPQLASRTRLPRVRFRRSSGLE